MIKIGFLFFLVIVCLAKADDNVPFLIFQKDASTFDNTVTIGQSLNSEDFLKQLSSINTNVDVILVDELSNQDLRKLLKNQKKNIFYAPAVESAYANLKSYLDKNQLDSNIDDFKMDVAGAVNEFTARQASSNLVILTALKSKDLVLKISKRAVETNDMPKAKAPVNSTTVFGEKCAAIYDSIYLVDNSNPSKVNRLDLSSDATDFECTETLSQLKLTVSSNKTLFDAAVKEVNLIFIQSVNTQYWQLASNSSVKTAAGTFGVTYMGAPYGMDTPNKFSFVCTRTYFQLYNSTVATKPLAKVNLYIENLQVQPNYVMNNGTLFTFGKVNYCQGFFTSGIWMALVSTFLLVMILSVGLSFLSGISTMDRFDDPKGKPLTIAQEK